MSEPQIIKDIENAGHAVEHKVADAIHKVEGKLSPAAKVAEADVKAAESAAWSYIEVNGLQDAYQIALSVLQAAVPGASWSGTLATVASKIEAAGKQIAKGTEAILAAQAQADLIAAGKLLPPAAA